MLTLVDPVTYVTGWPHSSTSSSLRVKLLWRRLCIHLCHSFSDGPQGRMAVQSLSKRWRGLKRKWEKQEKFCFIYLVLDCTLRYNYKLLSMTYKHACTSPPVISLPVQWYRLNFQPKPARWYPCVENYVKINPCEQATHHHWILIALKLTLMQVYWRLDTMHKVESLI